MSKAMENWNGLKSRAFLYDVSSIIYLMRLSSMVLWTRSLRFPDVVGRTLRGAVTS